MAKGQSAANREVKKPKKSKTVVAPASAYSVTPPKSVSPPPENKKK